MGSQAGASLIKQAGQAAVCHTLHKQFACPGLINQAFQMKRTDGHWSKVPSPISPGMLHNAGLYVMGQRRLFTGGSEPKRPHKSV